MFAFGAVDATQIGLAHTTNPALLEDLANRTERTHLLGTSSVTFNQLVDLFQQNNSADSKTGQ